MYSGIVEAIAKITDIIFKNQCKQFTLSLPKELNDTKIGDSVSVNGVCTTVSHVNENIIQFTAVPETLQKTNLDSLNINDEVNIERSITVQTRIGGHFISGHIDVTASIKSITDVGDAKLISFELPETFMKYIVNKGFIAVDGMSLTIIETTKNSFTLTLIPHTQSVTIAKNYKIDSIVNIEVDTVAKYIEKIIGASQHAFRLTEC